MNTKLRSILTLAIPIGFALIISYYLQGQFLYNVEGTKEWLLSFGPFIILVYIILQALSIIIAPIGGFVFALAMIAIFGPKIAVLLLLFTSTPCFFFNTNFSAILLPKIIDTPLVEFDRVKTDIQ